MPRLTVTITDDQAELLEELSTDGGPYESKSAAVRNFIQTGEERQELREEIARLEERLDTREERIEELERQLTERSRVEEKIEALPDRIRDGMSYQERRQRLLDSASPWERVKWKVTGVPVDERGDRDGGE